MSSSDQASTLSVVFKPKDNLEPQHRYEHGGYHPVTIGEIYNQRYEVIRKLGWGTCSTVWLVRDTQTQDVAAMKILVADLSDKDRNGSWDELAVLKILREKNHQSDGYRHVCQLLDSFTLQGPNGNHICLVLEAMKLNVLDLSIAYSKIIPLPILKRVTKHLLRALHYLHEECDIIHTDIKGDNILMAGSPPESTIILSEDDMMHATFKLSDFGAANMMSNRFASLIQPESLRAPEVLIGAEWDTKADIWNLGCLMFEFATGSKLFNPHWDNQNTKLSPIETHLAQIVGLCGNFDHEFLEQGSKSKNYFDDQGALLRGAGIFGTSVDELLVRAGHSISDTDVDGLADFMCFVLIPNPRERASAGELLDHPWVQNVE